MKWRDKVERERVRGDKLSEIEGREREEGKEKKGAEFNMFEYCLR